jgi:hypothetical protein
MVIEVLRGCFETRAQILNDIYQITGLSDIIRGESNPNETATAQRLKGQWGSLRVRDRQRDLQRFCRDAIRLKAEIIAEHFSVDTLKAMTNVKLLTAAEKQQIEQIMPALQQAQEAGIPIPPGIGPTPEQMELMQEPTWDEVMALLKNDALRSFRIDVETDSTVEPDENAAKMAFTEFTTATVGLLQAAAGIVGNLVQESGANLNTAAIGDNGTAFGMGQWRLSRRAALERFAAARGTAPTDFETQLLFLVEELHTTESAAGRRVLSAQWRPH